MEFEYTGGGRPRFVQPAKFGQSGSQLHISDAVCGVGLNGLVGRATSFFVTSAQQMAHCLRVKRSPAATALETNSVEKPKAKSVDKKISKKKILVEKVEKRKLRTPGSDQKTKYAGRNRDVIITPSLLK